LDFGVWIGWLGGDIGNVDKVAVLLLVMCCYVSAILLQGRVFLGWNGLSWSGCWDDLMLHGM
jgi:hypothetical protein